MIQDWSFSCLLFSQKFNGEDGICIAALSLMTFLFPCYILLTEHLWKHLAMAGKIPSMLPPSHSKNSHNGISQTKDNGLECWQGPTHLFILWFKGSAVAKKCKAYRIAKISSLCFIQHQDSYYMWRKIICSTQYLNWIWRVDVGHRDQDTILETLIPCTPWTQWVFAHERDLS